MRRLFLIITAFFTILSIVFVFLPLGTLGLLPVGVALLFGFLAHQKSNFLQKKLVKLLLIICGLASICIIGKELLIKDVVEKDVQFENTKIESKEEDKKDLEELENDLE